MSRPQRQGEQLLYAKAYLNGRSHKKFQKIDQDRLYPPRFGAPVVHLPAHDLIVWGFPNDPDLPHLPLVVDPLRVRQYLPVHALTAGDPKGLAGTDRTCERGFHIKTEVVRYKPGKRCTIRYEVRRDDSRGQNVQLFGKMLADETIGATYQHLTELWQHSLVESKSFGIAEPLGYDPRHHVFWQAAVSGIPLLEALCENNERPLMASIAQGLVDLHGSHLSPSARQNIPYHLAAAREQCDELTRAYPHFEEILHRLMVTIEQKAPDLAQHELKPIHRDFHVEQLLVQEHRLFMFDFDDLSMGDPMQDLGFFIVDLHYRKLNPEWVVHIATSLCQAYQDASAALLPISRLIWHIQVQFLAKAYWLFKKRQQKRSIQQEIMRALELAQRPFLIEQTR